MSYKPRPNPSLSKRRGPLPGRGGRPHKRNSHQLLRVIRVDEELYSFLVDQREGNRREHLGETNRRLIIQSREAILRKTQIINEQSEKIRELEQENRQLKEKLVI